MRGDEIVYVQNLIEERNTGDEGASLFSTPEQGDVWIPNSQISYRLKEGDLTTIGIPLWIAQKHNLNYDDYK